METVEWTIPHSSKCDSFHFYPIGDCHLGAIETAEHDLRAKVKTISEDPRAYMIGMGDYAECITKNDPRFSINGLAPWVEKGNIVESQRKYVVEIFKPLADQKKIICMLTGNHEEEIHKRHDNDVVRNICGDLRARYGGYQCFISLDFERCVKDTRTIIWHAWHGAGCAQTEGARVMRLLRLVNEIEAEIYTMGHIHGALSSYTPDRLSYDKRTHKIVSTKVIASLSGSWLKAFMQSTEERPLDPHYSEIKGYKPARIGCPKVVITPFSREITLVS